MGTPSKQTLVNMIKYGSLKYTSNPVFLNKLVDVMLSLKESYRLKGWLNNVTLTARDLMSFIENMTNGLPIDLCFYTSFAHVLTVDTLPNPDEVREELNALWLPKIELLEKAHLESITGETQTATTVTLDHSAVFDAIKNNK